MLSGVADAFQSVIDVFNFIASIIGTIIDGISGLISILGSIINLIISITRILPSPLYPCLLVFLSLYLTIFIYKVIRKG